MAQVFVCAENDPRCTVESCAWCFSGGASGKVVLAERQVRLQSLLWAGHADYESQATSSNEESQMLENAKMPGSEALLHCSNPVQDTCHWLLTIVALGWQVVVFQRHAVRCSTGLSSPDDTELVAKGLPMFVPASHLAAAQSGQRQGKRRRERDVPREVSVKASTLPATAVF